METAFTPLAPLGGGLTIGISAVLLMGATGVLGGLLLPADGSEFAWRVALVAGMVTAPILPMLSGNPVAVGVPGVFIFAAARSAGILAARPGPRLLGGRGVAA